MTWPRGADASSSTQSTYQPSPLLIKHRFAKQYRHPVLDAQLTRARVSAEARALTRCARAGVVVPTVQVVDADNGIIGMEWVEGWSVREVLGGGAEGEEEVEVDVEDLEEEGDEAEERSEAEQALERMGVSQGGYACCAASYGLRMLMTCPPQSPSCPRSGAPSGAFTKPGSSTAT